MPIYTQEHLTHSVIMAKPVDFGYNEQTSIDNQFQHKPNQSLTNKITQMAMAEFEAMVDKLTQYNIEVLVLDKSPTNQKLPDAIFPNNWFSTRSDGSLFIYPMKAENRQAEVQVSPLVKLLSQSGYQVSNMVDLRQKLPQASILEGTGSLVFHHPSGNLYATLSERCGRQALMSFCDSYHYQLSSFESSGEYKTPIYHTNVLMSCGENFAVIAKSLLVDNLEAKKAFKTLSNSLQDILIISEQQMTNNFCGNILQLKNKHEEACIIMSSSAYKGFSRQQLKILEKHGNLVECKIPTIEHIGGGSARCMLAENFLPRREKKRLSLTA